MDLLHGTETYGIVVWKRDTWNYCMEQRRMELLCGTETHGIAE
jgi:hypothetical protein